MPDRAVHTVLALLWLGGSSLIAQQEDRVGSKDHPLISRYPGSVIVQYLQKEFDEFNLPLGRITANNKIEKTQRLEGRVTRIYYEGPDGRSSLEVHRNYDAALRRAGFQALFTCEREACGQGFFRFGTDREDRWYQDFTPRHLTARLSRPEGEVYVSLHVEEQRRGSASRPTVWLDVIEMKPMESGLVTVDAAALAGDLARTGHVAVYGIYFDTGKAEIKPESEPALKEIAAVLRKDPNLNLHVVGHTDSAGDLAMNLELSRRRANAVVQALAVRHGIAAARLRAGGVGPLAPVASNKTEEGRARNRRVELVEQ